MSAKICFCSPLSLEFKFAKTNSCTFHAKPEHLVTKDRGFCDVHEVCLFAPFGVLKSAYRVCRKSQVCSTCLQAFKKQHSEGIRQRTPQQKPESCNQKIKLFHRCYTHEWLHQMFQARNDHPGWEINIGWMNLKYFGPLGPQEFQKQAETLWCNPYERAPE